VCVPDYEWRYHPKYVEQFSDKINCVMLHLVGYILEYASAVSVCCQVVSVTYESSAHLSLSVHRKENIQT
jgi:hypothetical protein